MGDDIYCDPYKQKNKFSPTLIIVNTTIGDGSKLEGTPKVHSGELTKEDAKKMSLAQISELMEKNPEAYNKFFN